MVVEVALNTPLADALSDLVQPKLSEIGWNTGGLDDSALGEYIILMLVNGKTQDQIAAELSNDLLNLEPDNTEPRDFSQWLFDQVEILSNQFNGSSAPQAQAQQPQAAPSISESVRPPQNASRGSDSVANPNGGIPDTMEVVQDGLMYVRSQSSNFFKIIYLTDLHRPTGPKSMRSINGGRNGNKRLMGQISKAMDRSNDSILHRVRPQQGTERINMHNRQPPKGPRVDQNRSQRLQPITRSVGMPNGGPPNGTFGSIGMPMTPQQQMQLFAMYEEQARIMAQIFSPQQQQIFMPGLPQPVVNPAFQNGLHNQQTQTGRSLFDRVESNPQRQNINLIKNPQQNGTFQTGEVNDTVMVTEPPTSPVNGNITSSSMEAEDSQTIRSEPSPDTICKFNLFCTNKDCIFAHQSPAAPTGTTIDVSDHCPFGAACKNRKCVARHPSPAQKQVHQSEQDCKFFPNCTNPSCPFRHPTMPMCRNGADCAREGCKFTHVKIMCKFNPCLNAACPYKHVEGQKRGVFDDKVWVAEGVQEKGHVSERKFVDDEMAEEELIVPENHVHKSQSSSIGAEVIT